VTGDVGLARAVIRDYRDAGLDTAERALMDFAVLVTRRPAAVDTRTIDGLRAHGWDDADILTATEIIGFFNYYARMADALGIEPEDFMIRDPEVWSYEESPGGDVAS
jgi:uncharacterized peroxidase-related enzyme